MPKQGSLEKMQIRQNFQNVWHTDLIGTASADLPYFCFAIWCAPCASYLLRKRALYDDMSRYVCCAGYMPCSGSCGERQCPEFCLCTETQHKVELDKRDGKFGPMQAPLPQQMSRIDQPVPPQVGYGPPPPQIGYAQQPPPAYGQPVAYGQQYPPPYGQAPYPPAYNQPYPSYPAPPGYYSGPPAGYPK